MKTIDINHRAEKIHEKVHRHAKNHVHFLRGKSDTYKKVFSITFALVVTLIVFMLWYLISLPKILNAYRTTQSENARLQDDPVDKLKDVFEEVKNPNITDLTEN